MNLLKIIIKNTYAHKNTVITFSEGMNYIVGKNESGKTVVLNMIAYALFGSGALRGPASDYKKLHVSLSFKINETLYLVERGTKDVIYEVVTVKGVKGKEELQLVDKAVGKTSVNSFITTLLGYGLDVFNRMNFSQQLDGDSYATSKKSERLDLINKINGVDEANQLEKYLDSLKRSFKSEIKGLDMSSIVNNVDFQVDPKLDHLTKDDIEKLTKESKDIYAKILQLNKIITAHSMIPDVPQLPQGLFHKSSLVNPYTEEELSLESYIEAYEAHVSHLNLIEKTLEDRSNFLRQHAVYDAEQNFIKEETVLELEQHLHNNKMFIHKQSLLSQGSIQCPHCDETFPLMYSSIGTLGDLEFIEIPFDEQYINKARFFVDNYLETCLNYESEISFLESEKEDKLQYVFKVDYQYAKSIKNEWDSYTVKLNQYQSSVNLFNKNYPDFTSITSVNMDLIYCEKELTRISDTRSKLENYLIEKGIFTSAQKAKSQIDTLVKDKQEKINAYDSLVEQSKALKLEIQNNSIPSLNKKASSIINKMTGGEHYSLTLSDTFELLLDGKIITAFSGSTQVTANVAFRIALIESFYKKTFPVFIGDEIDSFADATRAEHIHKSLGKLAEDGYQIILISHHSINFEGNVIDLNKIKGKS